MTRMIIHCKECKVKRLHREKIQGVWKVTICVGCDTIKNKVPYRRYHKSYPQFRLSKDAL